MRDHGDRARSRLVRLNKSIRTTKSYDRGLMTATHQRSESLSILSLVDAAKNSWIKSLSPSILIVYCDSLTDVSSYTSFIAQMRFSTMHLRILPPVLLNSSRPIVKRRWTTVTMNINNQIQVRLCKNDANNTIEQLILLLKHYQSPFLHRLKNAFPTLTNLKFFHVEDLPVELITKQLISLKTFALEMDCTHIANFHEFLRLISHISHSTFMYKFKLEAWRLLHLTLPPPPNKMALDLLHIVVGCWDSPNTVYFEGANTGIKQVSVQQRPIFFHIDKIWAYFSSFKSITVKGDWHFLELSPLFKFFGKMKPTTVDRLELNIICSHKVPCSRFFEGLELLISDWNPKILHVLLTIYPSCGLNQRAWSRSWSALFLLTEPSISTNNLESFLHLPSCTTTQHVSLSWVKPAISC